MTVCVAAVCDDGKALVLVADKMVGLGYVTSDLDITKMRPLHKDWWILFSGDDLSPVFDIIDYVKDALHSEHKLSPDDPASLKAVMKAVESGFEKKRLEDAETLYLEPIGWKMNMFINKGHGTLPNAVQIQSDIERFGLPIELLVAGFDTGSAFIFDLIGYGDKRGIANRCDIPGFKAIGSGSTVAEFMMYYRDFSPKEGVREAVYQAMEAKYYGEQASGVGERTDLFVARPGRELIQLNDEETIEKKLIPICHALSPSLIRKRDRDALNNLPELKDFPPIKETEKKTKPKPKKKRQPSLVPKGKVDKTKEKTSR
jgi:20S proteasome alpha/beta subunit